MARMRKKGQSGHRKIYINRDKAIKRLQLGIKDFRRLCILKGVYPVEPRRPGKISKSSKKKTYYLSSDIKYLSNEPLVWKFWEFKSYLKKLGHYKARGEFDRLNGLARAKPQLRLDHVLRDRYPKFEDALRDVDDALCMSFLYASLTKNDSLPEQVINYSKRLTLEFLHYVIESRSLRKVFVSIKGIYYQTCIQGQTVTFIIPHKLSFPERTDIDYSVMRTFTEFYINLLGFVNFRLYQSINMYYPPKVDIEKKKSKCVETDVKYTEGYEFLDRAWEHIASLNRPLLKSKKDTAIDGGDDTLEYFPDDLGYHDLIKFQKLFEGRKIFLSREVPRDSLTFIIRSFGGEVSWDRTLSIDATFEESDESITYQIVDRENVKAQYLNRQYVQPQWVYDSVNARKLLPAEDYFPGAKLPPHLSPFVEAKEGEYVPPEQEALQLHGRLKVTTEGEPTDEDKEDEEDDEDENMEEREEEDSDDDEEEEEEGEDDDDDNSQLASKKKILPKMEVKTGQVVKENLKQKRDKERKEELKMAEMMIPKKKKRLYNKIVKFQKCKRSEVEHLKKKRAAIELAAKKPSKALAKKKTPNKSK